MKIGYKRMIYSGVAIVTLAAAMTAGKIPSVLAVRSVSEIQQEQEQLKDELAELDSELVSLVSEIAELEAEIADTKQEISDTEEQLASAQEAVDRQYEAMKIRIRYMYENDNQSMLAILLESGSISDFLNRLEYVNAVYTYDRDLLDAYEATRQEIEDIKAALEEEKASLEAGRQELAGRKSELNRMIANKKSEQRDIEQELQQAQELAARQAALRRQQQQQAAAAAAAAAGSGGGGGSSGANVSSNSTGNVNGNLNPAPSSGVSGSAVVSYANQFVGNPYKWGGTDPVNGADCSGFIISVYRHFGIDFGGRVTSGGFRSIGNEVSYNNIQPGDIVCYAGHVAIYAGGGRIVEAQSTRAGITNNRSVNCKPIITIRRVL